VLYDVSVYCSLTTADEKWRIENMTYSDFKGADYKQFFAKYKRTQQMAVKNAYRVFCREAKKIMQNCGGDGAVFVSTGYDLRVTSRSNNWELLEAETIYKVTSDGKLFSTRWDYDYDPDTGISSRPLSVGVLISNRLAFDIDQFVKILENLSNKEYVKTVPSLPASR